MESLPWAVLLESPGRRIRAVNRRFCSLFLKDAAPETLLDTDSRWTWRHLDDLVEGSFSFVQETEELIRKGQPVTKQRIHLADGRVLEREYVPLSTTEGVVTRHLWVFSDVTEELRAEEHQLQIHKLEAVGRLAGGVAHDLNNALTAILGHASLLKLETEDRPELTGSLTEIQEAADRAASLARGLLAFGRRQVLQPRRVDPAELVRSLEYLLRRILGEDIELALDLPDASPAVRVDAMKLEHALLHLFMNARDAMPDGGLLSVSVRDIEVGASDLPRYPVPIESGHYSILSVRDTGTGIPDEIHAKVFEPFFSTKPKPRSTGLGLAVVYGFIKQSGGYIWFERQAIGATVHVALPVVEGAKPHHPGRAEADATHDEARLRAATILVAEDEEAVRSVIRRMLEGRGHRVIGARDGVEALEIMEEQGEAIDLLITDMVMPRMGGIELVRRATEIAPHIPVLFTSGYSRDLFQDLERPLEEIRLLEKPFQADALLRVVGEILGE